MFSHNMLLLNTYSDEMIVRRVAAALLWVNDFTYSTLTVSGVRSRAPIYSPDDGTGGVPTSLWNYFLAVPHTPFAVFSRIL